jgi:DNA polymerase-3 subunit gamma/tau
VRNRYKVFIIDEVHQLSAGSFNALLKSIEEPPPHVIFMMATTELDKIPETVLSRSQVYEFRAIGTKAIVDQLRRIVDAEGITAAEESLLLIARDADGSMRDAQSKLDQVIAFTGKTIKTDDVSTVLGLVGRDLMLEMLAAVADEDAAAAFALAGRAVEMGYDLRLVCRELSRVVRDLLVLSVDPSRASDPEIAGEGERDRMVALAGRFSREDLLRAFDLLTKAEFDIRGAAQPRYHLEMALLRWIYLRKLVAIEDLIAGAAGPAQGSGPKAQAPTMAQGSGPRAQAPTTAPGSGPKAPPTAQGSGLKAQAPTELPRATADGAAFKDALLAEIRKAKAVFYNTVVAQAQKIDVSSDRVVFTFSAAQRALRDRFETDRPWLENLAQPIAGRKMIFSSVLMDGAPPTAASTGDASAPGQKGGKPEDKKASLKEQALTDPGVKALLEMFPAEIRDVEEM